MRRQNLYETIKALEQAWETKFSKKEIRNIIANYNKQPKKETVVPRKEEKKET